MTDGHLLSSPEGDPSEVAEAVEAASPEILLSSLFPFSLNDRLIVRV